MISDQDPNPPVTLSERYGRAIGSSHLRATEGRCDLDYMIAAGWLAQGLDDQGFSKNGIGALLYRLRGEFDTARATVRRGAINRTEMALVLSHLKTLREAKDAFGRFAVVIATKEKFMQPDRVALAIAGRVLDVWLDERCHACDGRGFNGGSHRGEQKIKCGGCRGTGERRTQLGETAEERQFARRLLEEIADKLATVDSEMKRRLRQQPS